MMPLLRPLPRITPDLEALYDLGAATPRNRLRALWAAVRRLRRGPAGSKKGRARKIAGTPLS